MFRTVLITLALLTPIAATADEFVKLAGVTIHSDRAAIRDAAIEHFGCMRPSYTVHYGTIAADPNALIENQTAVLDGRRTITESNAVLQRLQSDTDESIWVALNMRRSSTDCTQ